MVVLTFKYVLPYWWSFRFRQPLSLWSCCFSVPLLLQRLSYNLDYTIELRRKTYIIERDDCEKGSICFFIHYNLALFCFHPLICSPLVPVMGGVDELLSFRHRFQIYLISCDLIANKEGFQFSSYKSVKYYMLG